MTPIPTAIDRLYEFAWAAAEVMLPRFLMALFVLGAGVLIARWVAQAVRLGLTPDSDPSRLL